MYTILLAAVLSLGTLISSASADTTCPSSRKVYGSCQIAGQAVQVQIELGLDRLGFMFYDARCKSVIFKGPNWVGVPLKAKIKPTEQVLVSARNGSIRIDYKESMGVIVPTDQTHFQVDATTRTGRLMAVETVQQPDRPKRDTLTNFDVELTHCEITPENADAIARLYR